MRAPGAYLPLAIEGPVRPCRQS